MIRPLTVAFCLVVAAAALQAQDWSQWRGPARSGLTEAFPAPAVWPDRPKKVWEARVGAGHSSPIVSGGRAFVLSRLGDDEVVTAFEWLLKRGPAASRQLSAAGDILRTVPARTLAGGRNELLVCSAGII